METFCLMFLKRKDEQFLVFCQNCALKMSGKLDNFIVLMQYKLSELIDLYDNFIMYQVRTAWWSLTYWSLQHEHVYTVTFLRVYFCSDIEWQL